MDVPKSLSPCGDRYSYRHALLLILMAALLIGLASPAANARGRSRGRGSAAAAKARKQRAIKAIQQQVAAAQQVLSMAESQAAMSQAEVSKAVEKLSGIREQIESERLSVRESNKSMQELETDILDGQGPESEFMRAKAGLKSAKHALRQTMHQVLALPDDSGKSDEAARLSDLAGLSTEDRKKLEDDLDYQMAQDKVTLAARHLAEVRRTLLEANTHWAAAHQALADDEKSVYHSSEQAQAAGLGSLGDRQQLHRAQTIASAARAIIAQGEAQLLRLGVKPQGNTSASTAQAKKR